MTGYEPHKIEEKVIEKWQENNTRKQILERNKGNEKFYFLDGPPYATGSIHMGTGMNKILKDYYLRFYRKKGLDVHAQPGYDTHGLPIENKVEEEEGFNSKKEIEEFGVEKFIKECQAFVDDHIEEMNKDFNDMGVWMDWENPYITYHDYYIEGAWQTFKAAYQKDYLYKDQYPVHVCTRCETAVAYNEIEYTKLTDPEVYVTMPIQDSDEELVIWTTTPWTLPANTAVMVHPEYEYNLIQFKDRKIWMAKELTETIIEKLQIEDYEVIKTVKGEELEGITYKNPLEGIVPAQDNVTGQVVLSERYVTLEDGTGMVHSAPGHGREDYEVGQEYNLKQISPVNLKGEYTEQAGKYEGTHVKDADPQIMEDLGENLLYDGKKHHEYPKCWRCDTPLLQLSIPQWFFGATKFRDQLLEQNEEVNWTPDWAGQKFHEWLKQLGDWPVSRQRYWGIPLPIWECNSCDHTKVVGDRDELPEVPDDLHRPYIDEVELECEQCNGTMERIPDVLDVWFDSGVAPWASLKHPEIDFTFEEEGPVDLELEGFDQIRGWWNSQFITSTMTYDQKPFENVIYHGKVMLEGKEMSKSKGIVVNPGEVIEEYGRDILRFYILSKDPGEDWSFEWDEVEETLDFMNIIWNTDQYIETYTQEREKPENLQTEDKWILSRLETLKEQVKKHSENKEAYKAAEEIEKFTKNDLSRTYIQIIRDRLKPGYQGEDRKQAEYTLREVRNQLLKVISPFTPHLSEYLWHEEETIHQYNLPEKQDERQEPELEESMQIFQDIEEAVARLRQEHGIKLRHPVRKVTVSGDQKVKDAVKELETLLEEQLNAKSVEFEKVELDYEVKLDYSKAGPELGDKVGKVEQELSKSNHKEIAEKVENQKEVELADETLNPEMFDVRRHVPEGTEGEEFRKGTVYLDTEMTEELLEEAFVNEFIRKVQQTRKEAELDVEDKVKLSIKGDIKPLKQNRNKIEERINLEKVEFNGEDHKHKGEISFEDWQAQFSFSNPVH